MKRGRVKPLEKDVQRSVVRLYKTLGCVVYSLSQPRASMQSPGIPDLLVFGPPRRMRQAWWHETKRPGGKQSPEQATFRDLCVQSAVHYVIGGVTEARAHLEGLGLLIRDVSPNPKAASGGGKSKGEVLSTAPKPVWDFPL